MGAFSRGSNGGETLRFRSRRTRATLAYLASEQRPVARDQLAFLLSPDEPLSKGRRNLSRDLHNLAQILPDCWEADRESVSFTSADNKALDIDLLDELEAARRFIQAADLVGGEFMEGLYLDDHPEFDTWLQHERETWREKSERILRHAIESCERRREYTHALELTHKLINLAPWQESAHRQLMRLLAWNGQEDQAIRHYAVCKKILREELDVAPSAETISVYEQIKSGELPLPPPVPSFLTEAESKWQRKLAQFVGREVEMARLEEALQDSLEGKPQFIFIAGNPGQGKTMLLDAFTERALETDPELLVARGNCNALSGVGDPYLPFKDIMRMFTGDVESLWKANTISPDQATRLWTATPKIMDLLLECGPQVLGAMVPTAHLWQRSQDAAKSGETWAARYLDYAERPKHQMVDFEQGFLFQQFMNVITTAAQDQPMVLLLDDIHWADPGSIGLLFHFGRLLPMEEQRIMMVCTYRPMEVLAGNGTAQSSLVKVFHEMKRIYGDVWIHLGEESEDQRRKFIDLFLDTEPNRISEKFREVLLSRTQGHPLFTVELLRTMKERGDIYRDERQIWCEGSSLDWGVIPARIEAVMADRLDRLAPDVREILLVASVIGETFTSQVIARVLDLEDYELIEAISQILANRYQLVSEEESMTSAKMRNHRYRFRHILYRDFLYGQLGLGKRQVLHEQVAAAMETLGSEDYPALAYHYEKAGVKPKALTCFTRAGQQALDVYANQEAEDYFRAALEIVEDETKKAYILAGLGESLERQDNFDEAIGMYWQSIDQVLKVGDLSLVAKLYTRLSISERQKDNWPGSLAIVRKGLSVLENAPDSDELAKFLNQAIVTHFYNNETAQLNTLTERALVMAERVGSNSAKAGALFGKVYSRMLINHDYNEISSMYQQIIEISEPAGMLVYLARAYNNLGMMVRDNDPDAGAEYFRKAKRVVEKTGIRWWQEFSTGEIRTQVRMGNFRKALRLYDSIFLGNEMREDHSMNPRATYLEGTNTGYLGSVNEAIETLRPLWQILIRSGNIQSINQVGIMLAEFYLEEGLTGEAQGILASLLGENRFAIHPKYILRPFTLKAMAHIQTGALEEAEALLEKNSWRYRQYNITSQYELLWMARVRGLLLTAGRRWEDCWDTYAEAVETAENLGFRWMRTRLRLYWAEAHFARGGAEFIDQGSRMMDAAQAEFEEMGADGWVERIRDRKEKIIG